MRRTLVIWFFATLKFLPKKENLQRWSRGHKDRGQGQGHKKISRPRTDPLKAKVKDQGHRRKCSPKKEGFQKIFSSNLKKGLQNYFSGENGLQKLFFRRFPQEENKKTSSQIFLRGFWRFPTKFQRFKK